MNAPPAAPALKEIFNRDRLVAIAGAVRAAHPAFDEAHFLKRAARDLDALSIMQRLRQIAESLGETLPADFGESVAILKIVAPRIGHNFAAILPSEYVALFGQAHFDQSMEALAFFTRFGSAEFAIRHFLHRDFERTLAVMAGWAEDSNEHVRRLASEGSRPRLPWAARLPQVIADPSLTRPILERLKADPSLSVRKSVANHVNDITKDHPAHALGLISSWPMDDPRTAWIVKHALRGLIKAGDPAALARIGATGKALVRIEDFAVSPTRIRLGGRIAISCVLHSTGPDPQRLVVDYAIHYVKKSGATSRKVFKLKELHLAPEARTMLAVSQTIRDFTTRTHHAGRHAVELLVNGAVLAEGFFDLA
jgi:3-methyladenine DNA glycosylase AlkC